MLAGQVNSHLMTGKIPILFRLLFSGHSLGESYHDYNSHLATVTLETLTDQRSEFALQSLFQ